MIGKNPLLVARQHGHSLTTMFRTYAAWMDGARESDIETIDAAMKTERPLLGRVPNNDLPRDRVAGLGTRLATGETAPAAQVAEKRARKKVAERVGFEPTCRNYPTIRFRVGAVMTTSVPLR
jgi:hypothetical protein